MIIIEPDKVDENANRIESLGIKMKEKMQEVNQKVKALSSDWQDQKQQNYDAEFTKLVQSFDSFAENIPAYAKEAHAHADHMRKTGNA